MVARGELLNVMQVRFHSSARAFLDEAKSSLLLDEAENHFLLGTAAEWATGGMPEGSGLATVIDDEATVAGERSIAAAALVSPFTVMMTRATAEAVEELVEHLAEGPLAVGGVSAPEPTADLFAELWERRTGKTAKHSMRQRIHCLEEIEPGLRECPGTARWAKEDDADHVAGWISRFGKEVGFPMDGPRMARERIAERAILLWEDGGEVVTMAGWAGPTPNGVRIYLVYTPSKLRGHGYATACTAEITRRLLTEGNRYCFLYTDLANPTSNSIYLKIGYRPVCDVATHYGFA